MLTSAVASSTAVGVFETLIPRSVQAWTSTWSYPAPDMVSLLCNTENLGRNARYSSYWTEGKVTHTKLQMVSSPDNRLSDN